MFAFQDEHSDCNTDKKQVVKLKFGLINPEL